LEKVLFCPMFPRLSPRSPVFEGSFNRADIKAAVAEVTLPFPIVPLCLICGARTLTLSARDAGIGPPDLEPAPHGRNRGKSPERADEPAEGAIEEERDCDDCQENKESCRQ